MNNEHMPHVKKFYQMNGNRQNVLQRRFLLFVWRSIQSRRVKVSQSDATIRRMPCQFFNKKILCHANQLLNLNGISNDSAAVKEGAA